MGDGGSKEAPPPEAPPAHNAPAAGRTNAAAPAHHRDPQSNARERELYEGQRRRARTTGSETQGLVPLSVLDSEKWERVARGGENPTIKEPIGVRILGMRFLDTSILECTSCAVPFTTTNRRHWCRRCGRIYCNICSSKRQQLYTGGPPLRVCRKCALPALFKLPIPVMQLIASYHDSATLAVSLHVCHRFQLSMNLPYAEVRNIHDIYDKNATKYLQKGAFGCVYSARHAAKDHPAAIKVIDKYHVYSLREWRFIQREILLHKELNHSHIVALHEVWQTRSKVYIVMDLGKGDLFDYMMSRGYMTEKEVLSIAVQLLTALEYLHRVANVVHRDIKPENALVFENPDGDPFPIVKLCDFGLAKQFNATPSPETVSCTPCGTLNYCPPEVLTKAGSTTTDRLCKLDIFSLGILLHVLITGSEPFKGRSSAEILRSMKRPLALTGSEWDNISAALKTTVASMLRYQMPMRPTASEALLMLADDAGLTVHEATLEKPSAGAGGVPWSSFVTAGNLGSAAGSASARTPHTLLSAQPATLHSPMSGTSPGLGPRDAAGPVSSVASSSPPLSPSPAFASGAVAATTSAIPMKTNQQHYLSVAGSKSPGMSVPMVSSAGTLRVRPSCARATPILDSETFKDRMGLRAQDPIEYRVDDGTQGDMQVSTKRREQRPSNVELPDELRDVHTYVNFDCFACDPNTADPVSPGEGFLEPEHSRPVAIPNGSMGGLGLSSSLH